MRNYIEGFIMGKDRYIMVKSGSKNPVFFYLTSIINYLRRRGKIQNIFTTEI